MLTRPPDEVPVNDPELTLRTMLERAGLQGFLPQHPIELGRTAWDDGSGLLLRVTQYGHLRGTVHLP
jgi:hypothetical protein